MSPFDTVTRSASQTYHEVTSARSSVASVSEKMMSVPPMVGVPAFLACDCGPSSRIDWRICSSVSRRMSRGPMTSDTTRAVRPATRVRNVMYLKTFSGSKWARSW